MSTHSKVLGERDEVNNYKNKLQKFRDGLEKQIEYYSELKELESREIGFVKKIVSMERTVVEDVLNVSNRIENDNKNNRFNSGELNSDIKWNLNNLNSLQVEKNLFLIKEFEKLIKKMKTHKKSIEALLAIYDRKQGHMLFLMDLISLKDNIRIEKQTQFIRQLNEDLTNEINTFIKMNESNLYCFLNHFFESKYKTECKIKSEIFDKIKPENYGNSLEKDERIEELLEKKDDDF